MRRMRSPSADPDVSRCRLACLPRHCPPAAALPQGLHVESVERGCEGGEAALAALPRRHWGVWWGGCRAARGRGWAAPLRDGHARDALVASFRGSHRRRRQLRLVASAAGGSGWRACSGRQLRRVVAWHDVAATGAAIFTRHGGNRRSRPSAAATTGSGSRGDGGGRAQSTATDQKGPPAVPVLEFPTEPVSAPLAGGSPGLERIPTLLLSPARTTAAAVTAVITDAAPSTSLRTYTPGPVRCRRRPSPLFGGQRWWSRTARGGGRHDSVGEGRCAGKRCALAWRRQGAVVPCWTTSGCVRSPRA